MSAGVDSIPDLRTDAARWVICFAIVMACYYAGALALLTNVSETSDSGVDAPVVMLDLPEALTPSDAPVRDLPPGPMETEETEATPPPKEEAKPPPEPQADVALPMPEPPKPEPPAEEMHSTAPVAAKTPPKAVIRWQGLLAAHIERFKRYPAAARSRGDKGIAKVAFTIDREGRLLSSRIVESSGSAALDQETLAMLARAQPMPRPPDELSGAELTFVVPVQFNIR